MPLTMSADTPYTLVWKDARARRTRLRLESRDLESKSQDIDKNTAEIRPRSLTARGKQTTPR